MKRKKWLVTAGLSVFFLFLSATATLTAQGTTASTQIESDQASFKSVRVVDGLEHPWGMTFLPGGDLLITERPGRLRIWKNDRLETVSGLPELYSAGQGGLLDIALHPDFTANRLIYFTASVSGPGGAGTALYRARLTGSALEDIRELYRLPRFTSTRVHFGSRIVFAPDGTLYMSIGERGDRRRAQRLDDAAGSILRFTDDGNIPEDNPFVDRRGALSEIYSYGHRNPQGIAVHPQTGEIWTHEHGPRGGDEVNIIRSGRNYGWPLVTFGEEYRGGTIGMGTEAPGIVSPLIHWTPSIAPSGMAFYTGDRFPEWKGDLFVGALAGKHLRRLELDGNRIIGQEVLLENQIGRIRDVEQGPDGYLWLLTDESDGGLYRLEP